MGKFYTDKLNRPCFQSGEEEAENILTHKISGMKLVVNSNPKELVPGEYLYIGQISNRVVKFTKVLSYTNDFVETYAGEFTVGPNGAIQFPSSILWAFSKQDFREGCTYRYIIQNGLGKIEEYANPSDWNGKFSWGYNTPDLT